MCMRLRITNEALSLFADLRPCPECGRPLPVPFEDNYQHWEGCSVGEREERGSQDVVKIPLAPLEPCPECRRLLPTPLYGGYQHWKGCSVGKREKSSTEPVSTNE